MSREASDAPLESWDFRLQVNDTREIRSFCRFDPGNDPRGTQGVIGGIQMTGFHQQVNSFTVLWGDSGPGLDALRSTQGFY